MSNWLEGTPAYGREYNNQKAVKDDWKAGLDFRDTVTGRYFNIDSMKLPEMADTKVLIRYYGLTKVVGVN